jgi:lipopolysaccharide export system protein LptC
MTAQADAIRNRRRQFAAPGGSHDRLVGLLKKALPAGIGAVAAVMIIAPLTPRGEVSFLLDRKKVAVTQDRLAVDHAQYRGTDNDDRPFEVTAGKAVQAAPTVPVVAMSDLQARIQMNEGPARVSAGHGNYNYTTDKISSSEPVTFDAADGYSMVMRNVDIDLKTRTASGAGGVDGTVPSGTFSSQRITADLAARTIALEGNARLRMVPGKLRMPK